MIRVLFVCAGNICRSPMAEAVMQHLVNAAGLQDQIEVDSAGTGGWHVGERAHHGTLKQLKTNNIPYNGRARQFTKRDLDHFNYVVAMDTENLGNIQRIAQGVGGEVALLLDYSGRAGTTTMKEVPDPYYDGTFDRVYDLVTKGCTALLAHIRQEHNL